MTTVGVDIIVLFFFLCSKEACNKNNKFGLQWKSLATAAVTQRRRKEKEKEKTKREKEKKKSLVMWREKISHVQQKRFAPPEY